MPRSMENAAGWQQSCSCFRIRHQQRTKWSMCFFVGCLDTLDASALLPWGNVHRVLASACMSGGGLADGYARPMEVAAFGKGSRIVDQMIGKGVFKSRDNRCGLPLGSVWIALSHTLKPSA